jgi:hypothetical protein
MKAILAAMSSIMLLTAANSYPQSPFLVDTVAVSSSHFEVLPQAIKQVCKKVLTLQKGPLIVYAHIKGAEYDYYAVWDESSNRDEYYEGSILEIRGGLCKGYDLEPLLATHVPRNGYRGGSHEAGLPGDDAPIEGTPPNQVWVFKSAEEEDLFRQLVRDAIQRDAKAHGGDIPYRLQACKPSVEANLSQAGYVVVLQELKAYCSQTPQK